MDSQEIKYILNKLCPSHFEGVFPSDKLPDKNNAKQTLKCYIINLDKSTEPGSHWVAVIIQPKKNKVIYFDSYGQKPTVPSVQAFVGDTFEHNPIQLQHPLSTTCGEWCIMFILCYVTGHSLKCLVNMFKSSTDLLLNDYAVNKFVNKISGKRRRLIDRQFLQEQISRSLRENKMIKN